MGWTSETTPRETTLREITDEAIERNRGRIDLELKLQCKKYVEKIINTSLKNKTRMLSAAQAGSGKATLFQEYDISLELGNCFLINQEKITQTIEKRINRKGVVVHCERLIDLERGELEGYNITAEW